MNSITICLSILVFPLILFEWSDCRVLSLHRDRYRADFHAGVRGFAPGRNRWFRTYGRHGDYDNDDVGYDRGMYDRDYDRDVDIRNRENVKVNVKVYTDGRNRDRYNGYNGYD